MFTHNNKYISFKGEQAKLLSCLDSSTVRYVKDIGGEEIIIPSMIEKEILERTGYFNKIPENITKVTTFNTDATNEMYLTPAACIHVYPLFENQSVNKKIITTSGRVYRYEEKGFKESTRFWDFSVREIILFGDDDFIQKNIDRFKSKLEQLLSYMKIDFSWKAASDCFYPSLENKMHMRIQKANKLKYELTVQIGSKDVAILSTNKHNYHFSKEFGFDNNNNIKTACIAFGNERWISMFTERGITSLQLQEALEKIW